MVRSPDSLIADCLLSHSLRRRLPDELVDLQSQPDVESVLQDPLRQRPRIELAVGRIALRARILEKSRREDYAMDLAFQLMLAREVAGELVVGAVSENELDLIAWRERLEVAQAKGLAFARAGTLHVHNLMYGSGHALQLALAACFQQQRVAPSEQALHHRHQFAFL